MDWKLLLKLAVAQLSGQETSLAEKECVEGLNYLNSLESAGISDADIATTAKTLCAIGLATQNKIVASITK